MSIGARPTAAPPASTAEITEALGPLRAAFREVSTIEERGRITELLPALS